VESRLDIDFDAIYQGTLDVPGVAATGIPWDIAAPQPAVVEWAADGAGRFAGAVLDIGCGTGDNAVHLASRGLAVTAVDGASGAVDLARARAAAQGVSVEFAVADAFRLPYAHPSPDHHPNRGAARRCPIPRFDTVLDCALYHCLDPSVRGAYAAELHRVTRPGARLNLLGVSDRAPEGTPPSRVSERGLRDTLTAAGWTITALREHRITSVIPPDALALFGLDLGADADGRVRIPAWAVEADRR
jgi:SAM-dependent methyltransferase